MSPLRGCGIILLAASKCNQASRYRKREIKDRAVSRLTGNADLAAVSFDDRLGDGQSHARALHLQALVATAIKLLEDQGLFEVVDARSAISDTDHHHAAPGFRSDVDG